MNRIPCVSDICWLPFGGHPAQYEATENCGVRVPYCVKAVARIMNQETHRCPVCGFTHTGIRGYVPLLYVTDDEETDG